MFIVYEYFDYDLSKYLRRHSNLSLDVIKRFTWQILSALEFMHSRRVLHRDLKPPNILVDAHGNLKLADFGLARVVTVPLRAYTVEIITLWYRPPEILLGEQQYAAEVDMWSAGAILAELATGRPIFHGASEDDQLNQIFIVLGTPTERTWPGVHSLPGFTSSLVNSPGKNLHTVLPILGETGIDLVRRLCAYCPYQRISARQALRHPFFNGFF